jgi:hypothetical protein
MRSLGRQQENIEKLLSSMQSLQQEVVKTGQAQVKLTSEQHRLHQELLSAEAAVEAEQVEEASERLSEISAEEHEQGHQACAESPSRSLPPTRPATPAAESDSDTELEDLVPTQVTLPASPRAAIQQNACMPTATARTLYA